MLVSSRSVLCDQPWDHERSRVVLKPENKTYPVIRPKGELEIFGGWSGSFESTDNNSVADSIAKCVNSRPGPVGSIFRNRFSSYVFASQLLFVLEKRQSTTRS